LNLRLKKLRMSPSAMQLKDITPDLILS
jgi:hypothetical protein